jgi:hypothetical protein
MSLVEWSLGEWLLGEWLLGESLLGESLLGELTSYRMCLFSIPAHMYYANKAFAHLA